MDLELDEQQRLLKQAADRFLEKRLPFATRAAQKGEDFTRFWSELDAELGIAGAGLPEEFGGFGGGAEAEMIVAASLGGALAVTPYIDSLVISANLLAGIGLSDLVKELVSGQTLAVTAIEEPQTRGDIRAIEARASASNGGWRLDGQKITVNFVASADLVLVPVRIDGKEPALFGLGREALAGRVHAYALIDQTPSADIDLDGLEIAGEALLARGPGVETSIEAAILRGTAALCAEGAAIAEVMLADTVAYSKDRAQFGAALASFQALQHRMVDMYLKSQELAAASLLATLKVTDPAAVSAAKATVSGGLRKIGQEAVQLHGAMGLTEELRVGHYFKRATVIEHRLGNADRHIANYGAIRLGSTAAA